MSYHTKERNKVVVGIYSLHIYHMYLLWDIYLVVRQESLSLRVRARITTTCLLVYVSSWIVICVTARKCEGTTVQRYTDDQFVGRAPFVFPKQKAIVLYI